MIILNMLQYNMIVIIIVIIHMIKPLKAADLAQACLSYETS
jgi:hypothetical protein